MKKQLSTSLLTLCLFACNDDELYTTNAIAVNHLGPDVDVLYHNSDYSSSLTELTGLQYAEISNWNLLTQDTQDETVYTFNAIDANSQEQLIDKISFDLSGIENVLLFTYGKESGVEQQKATLRGLALDFEDFSSEKYALYVVHAYPAELGELAVTMNGAEQSVELTEDGLGYGHATTRFSLDPTINQLEVSQPDSQNAPLLKETFFFEPNTLNVLFIAPQSHNNNHIKAFKYTVNDPLNDLS